MNKVVKLLAIIRNVIIITICIIVFLRTTNAQQYDPIAGYIPETDVSEQILLDTDQVAYTAQLALLTNNGFQSARGIYEQPQSTTRRSLQSFSNNADIEMRDVNTEFYPYFQKYLDYFGQTSFANDFIIAAIDGTVTTSGLSGNYDFTKYGYDGRAIIAEKSTVLLSIVPYIVRNIDYAIEICSVNSNDSAAVGLIDEAVAYYVGSLESTSNNGGVFMYNEANERCKDMKTCEGNTDTGISQVNTRIIAEFETIRDKINNQICDDIIANKDEIIRLVQILFIQGTLSYAYKNTINTPSTTSEEDIAAGTIYAATILPMINVCNFDDSVIIYNNTKPGVNDIDYIAIRDALENNYDCLGISCEEIGGMWNTNTQQYYDDAQLCGQPTNAPTTSTTAPVATTTPVMSPTTMSPVMMSPTTMSPVMMSPTTEQPVDNVPTTISPVSTPTTQAPVIVPDSTTSPTTIGPTTAAPFLSTPTTSAPTGPECQVNAGCADLGLTGLCCPTIDNVFLTCCGGTIELTCESNPKCDELGLTGACCPAENNLYLDCCTTVPDECLNNNDNDQCKLESAEEYLRIQQESSTSVGAATTNGVNVKNVNMMIIIQSITLLICLAFI